MKQKNRWYIFLSISVALVFSFFSCRTERSKTANQVLNAPLFQYQNIETRWNSFENPTSGKGAGGKENKTAKGHAYDVLKAGESKVLLDVDGMGIITRMWFTIRDKSPQMLRSIKIEMFWDGNSEPAVSAPFGDFFGNGLGRLVAFENELFVNPEGRSFSCFIPMPFKSGAKVVITNEGDSNQPMLFYDINFVKLKEWNPENLYFHCFWNRDTATTPGVDYTILPQINGKGRFLGVNFGVIGNPVYKDSWWGEGEVKMYIDGDTDFPTLVGTGTEDYIGTGWGQGEFSTRYSGCLVADTKQRSWTFYRYHIPDPVYFNSDIRVAIQTMGGYDKNIVIELLKEGAPLIPVSIIGNKFVRLMDSVPPVNLLTDDLINGWTNFYRSDDWSSTAYFYLDKPVSQLPDLADVNLRKYKM